MIQNYRHRLTVGICLVFVGSLGGCASGQTSGQRLGLPQQESAVSFYVERQEKDGRNLAASIVENLAGRGYAATSGEAGTGPDDATYVLKYVDHWAWDMRMFLSDLRIEVRDPTTGAILAYGQSVQNSLKAMGWTHETVIDLAVSEILGAPLLDAE